MILRDILHNFNVVTHYVYILINNKYAMGIIVYKVNNIQLDETLKISRPRVWVSLLKDAVYLCNK